MRQKTAQVNQIRGLLMEYGVVIPQEIKHIKKVVVKIYNETSSGDCSINKIDSKQVRPAFAKPVLAIDHQRSGK